MTVQPITGEYDRGPVTIKWNISGDGLTSCRVHVLFETDEVAVNTLSPDNVNWDTGRHEASNGWVEASFQMQVPTAGQDGQLVLQGLTWEQGQEGEQHVSNTLLQDWTQTGPGT